MKFLLTTTPDAEQPETDINCFYIDIDKELAKKILSRRKKFLEMKNEDPPLVSLRYNDMFGEWIEDADAYAVLDSDNSGIMKEPLVFKFLNLEGKEQEW